MLCELSKIDGKAEDSKGFYLTVSGNREEIILIMTNMKRGKHTSRLALAVALRGWLLFVAWLSYDYAKYQNRWIIHIFRAAHDYEIHGFHILIFLVPFVYTTLTKEKSSSKK